MPQLRFKMKLTCLILGHKYPNTAQPTWSLDCLRGDKPKLRDETTEEIEVRTHMPPLDIPYSEKIRQTSYGRYSHNTVMINGVTAKNKTNFIVNGKKLKKGTPEYEKAKTAFNKSMSDFEDSMDEFGKSMKEMAKDLKDIFK